MYVFLSRKVLLAFVALLQTIVLNYLGVPKEIWMQINAALVVVIAYIGIDDARQKSQDTFDFENKWKRLLKSKTFWTAVVSIFVTALQYYQLLPADVTQNIQSILLAFVVATTVEDSDLISSEG